MTELGQHTHRLETIDEVARFLSLNCPDSLKDSVYNSTTFPSAEAFATFLFRHITYYLQVKDIYPDQDLSQFWPTFLSNVRVAVSEKPRDLGSLARATKLVESFRPKVTAFIKADSSIPLWEPSRPHKRGSEVMDHVLALKTLSITNIPQLEIYNLGEFKEDDVLNARVRSLFQPKSHAFLMNSSGTGKTRLLYEGLCQNWGIYLPCSRDSSRLGSSNLGHALHEAIPRDPGFVSQLPEPSSLAFKAWRASNIRTVQRHLNTALLAHPLVLRLFLQTLGELEETITDKHKKQWLRIQLHSSVMGSRDIFFEIDFFHLSQAPDDGVSDLIRRCITDIQGLCPDQPLFLVLDEANVPAREYSQAFRDAGGEHPFLKEIVRTWKDMLDDQGVYLIVAGTDIPKIYFSDSEWSGFRWSSDTGAFENEASQRKYLERFIPASLESREQLIHELWRWCRHRHRFTASIVSTLLRNVFDTPRRNLHDLINALTQSEIAGKHLPAEVISSSYPLMGTTDFHAFPPLFDLCRKDMLIQMTVREVLAHYLVASCHPVEPYDHTRSEMVRIGMGRFTDATMTQVAMDDTFMIVSAVLWCENGTGSPRRTDSDKLHLDRLFSFESFLDVFQHPVEPPYQPGAFLTLYLGRVFTQTRRRVCTVFQSSRKDVTSQRWWKRSAQIVVFGADGSYDALQPSDLAPDAPPLAFSARNMSDVVSWLNHKHRAAFCLCPHGCGADIIFSLKLSNGKLTWVLLRATGTGSDKPPSNEQLGKDIEALLPHSLFTDQLPLSERGSKSVVDDLVHAFSNLPNPLTTKASPILRVIASFPTGPDLTSFEENPHSSPVVTLKVTLLKEILSSISSDEVIEGVVSSVLGKRKIAEGHGPRPPKRRDVRQRETERTSSPLPIETGGSALVMRKSRRTSPRRP